MNRIAIDTRQPSIVYAATSEGLFRSLDGGAAWRDVAPREAAVGGLLSALAVVTSTRGAVYASFEGHTRGGLFRSLDRGATWQAVGPDLPGPTLALAVDPRQHLVFAGTWNGLFESRDGVTWSPAGLAFEIVSEVLADPHQPGRLLAVTLQGYHGLATPVIHVRENGNRWRRSSLGREGTAFGRAALAADPATPDTFYATAAETLEDGADLYRSTDGGRRWKPVHQGRGMTALAVHPRRPGALLAGSGILDTGVAVLRSDNHGATWTPSGTGLQAVLLNDFAAASGHLYSLLRCCSLWRSEAGGGAWRRTPGGPAISGLSLGVDPADPAALYLGSHDGLWRSPDHGETWSELGRIRGAVWDIAADPTVPGLLYFILDGGLARSDDGGYSWGRTPTAASRLVALGPGAPAAAWIQSEPVVQSASDEPGPNRVLRSLDGGLTWETLLTLGAVDEQVTAIAPDPADPRRAVVGFTRFVSSPYGQETKAGGVFRTTDGGATWEPSRLPNRRPVFSLAIDPRDPERVFAGTFGGVFVSTDGGATWSATSEGLPASQVFRLAFDPGDPGVLYAATQGGGVWRLARLE